MDNPKIEVWRKYYQRHIEGETYKEIGLTVDRTGSSIREAIFKYLRRLKTGKELVNCPGCDSYLKKRLWKNGSGYTLFCSNKRCGFEDFVKYDHANQLKLLSGQNIK